MHFLLMFSEVWNIKANKQKDAIVSSTIAPLLLIRAYNIPYYLLIATPVFFLYNNPAVLDHCLKPVIPQFMQIQCGFFSHGQFG